MANKNKIIKVLSIIIIEGLLLFCIISMSSILHCGYRPDYYNYDLSPVISTDIQRYEALVLELHTNNGLVYVYNNNQIIDTILLYLNNAKLLEHAAYKHKYYGDSIAVFYYRKIISPYRFCTIFFDEIDYIPDSLASIAQSFDNIEYMTDRHKSRYLWGYVEDLNCINRAKNEYNTLRIDTLYLYVSSLYFNDIYAFSKESINHVKDFFYFDWGYNCYALNVNTSIDLKKEGVLLTGDRYGSLYLIPEINNFDTKMRMKKDIDGKYRLTGVIPERDTLTNYILYNDEWCFKFINKLVYNYFYGEKEK